MAVRIRYLSRNTKPVHVIHSNVFDYMNYICTAKRSARVRITSRNFTVLLTAGICLRQQNKYYLHKYIELQAVEYQLLKQWQVILIS